MGAFLEYLYSLRVVHSKWLRYQPLTTIFTAILFVLYMIVIGLGVMSIESVDKTIAEDLRIENTDKVVGSVLNDDGSYDLSLSSDNSTQLTVGVDETIYTVAAATDDWVYYATANGKGWYQTGDDLLTNVETDVLKDKTTAVVQDTKVTVSVGEYIYKVSINADGEFVITLNDDAKKPTTFTVPYLSALQVNELAEAKCKVTVHGAYTKRIEHVNVGVSTKVSEPTYCKGVNVLANPMPRTYGLVLFGRSGLGLCLFVLLLIGGVEISKHRKAEKENKGPKEKVKGKNKKKRKLKLGKLGLSKSTKIGLLLVAIAGVLTFLLF